MAWIFMGRMLSWKGRGGTGRYLGAVSRQFDDNRGRGHAARLGAAVLASLLALGAMAAQAADDAGMTRDAAFARAAALSALGRRMFFDPALSASGRLACASCHDPAHGFSPANDLPVQRGGPDLRQSGVRAVPSLMYLQATPQFTEHFFDSDEEGDGSVDNGPTGGLTWDGRVDRGRDQARIPLLSPYEMANRTPGEVVARARSAGYGEALRRLYRTGARHGVDAAFATILEALETFEEDPATFYPYTSKYDAFLAGKAALSPAEARGLALFENPAKGDCARCHISRPGKDGTPPQFTDYGLIALGVPRNPAIPANGDPAYYDLGLCGPLRTDLAGHPQYCGLFKTPSLRGVAVKRSFFHNGAFHALRRAVEFYAERDSDPGKWYARNGDGSVRKFDDLPPRYHANVETDPPFGGHRGGRPALDASEIDDVVAFLRTLTDGFSHAPGNGARRP
jgi:cytochrome c peroxidase